MGTGKTILMATCIFYEFLLGNKFEKDARYCHNALVFAPDKTVLHSLKEIESFDLTRVVPPEYVNFLTTHLRFHYLEEAGTSLDTLDRSRFNIIVSNTQKIILKRQRKETSRRLTLMLARPFTRIVCFPSLAKWSICLKSMNVGSSNIPLCLAIRLLSILKWASVFC